MPIKGLTDKAPTLPRIGILRKGGKKTSETRPGPDLDYFRFVADDPATEAAFREAYGAQPRQVNVFLPFDTVDQNYEAWKEDWKASALQHRCDGETCVLWLTPSGKYSQEPRKCPGNCKQVGRLSVIVPELGRLATITVLTTGKWDVMNLHQSLMALDQAKPGTTLRGIPLVLRRVEREISTPEFSRDGRPTGKRVRRKKWLIQIEAAPRWVALQLQAAERAALPGANIQQLQLNAAPEVLDADDDDAGEDFSELVGAIVPPAGEINSTGTPEDLQPPTATTGATLGRIDQALLDYCIQQKGEKNGPAFFKAQYGQKAIEQKEAIANSLGLLSAPALEEVEAEPVDDRDMEIAEIESLFNQLKSLGKPSTEIDAQVARMANGLFALDEMDVETLREVKGGLEFWRDQLKADLAKGAAK